MLDTRAMSHWHQLKDLFSRTLDLPENERMPFVQRETASEPVLRHALLEFIAWHRCRNKRLGRELEKAFEAARTAALTETAGRDTTPRETAGASTHAVDLTPTVQRLASVMRWMLSKEAYLRYVEPHIADIQQEHPQAIAAGRVWHARWIIVRGCCQMLSPFCQALFRTIERLYKLIGGG
jgi:hypothetical protein